jgi:hypothetical protein
VGFFGQIPTLFLHRSPASTSIAGTGTASRHRMLSLLQSLALGLPR